MFRGDLQHTGVYGGSGVPKQSGIKWKFHTGGRVISSPAVVNGVAYVGSTDGNLYAIDAGTGTLKWKFGTKSWEVSSPARFTSAAAMATSIPWTLLRAR